MPGRAALGFRAHTGWTAAVAVTGPASAPSVLDRRRVELAEGVAAVYHAAQELPLPAAERLVRDTQAAARRLARAGLEALARELGKIIAGVGIVGGGGRLPATLAEILRAHPLVHSAEGELYRAALAAAADELGWPVIVVPASELHATAAAAHGLSVDDVKRVATESGRSLGKPWAQDQKESMIAAWLALSSAS